MKNKILFLCLCISVIGLAQTTELEDSLKARKDKTPMGLNYGGVTALNFSQTSLTNWSAGGNNSVSVNGLVNLYLNYRKESTIWNNTLDIGYGLLKQGKDADVVKTDDHVEINSKYGVNARENWYYSGMINFVTQMANGYQDSGDSVKISAPFAPAYFTGAIGMDYQKNDDFNLYLSPLTTKITFVLDEELSEKGAFGVKDDQSYRVELGGYIRTHLRLNLMQNVTMNTDLSLFSNYLDQPQNVDVDWKVFIAMKVNEYISANIMTHLIYDDNIKTVNDQGEEQGPEIQFKDIIGIGFSYSF